MSTPGLIIRNAQLEAFRQHRRADLRARLLLHLRGIAQAKAPELDDADLDALVERGWAQARRFRLEREVDLARFLEIVVALPPPLRDGDLPVPALQILLDWSADAVDKIHRFRRWAEDGTPKAGALR